MALAVAVVAGLAGCTGSATPPSPTPTLTGEQANAATVAARDEAWAMVHDQFPDAIRPDVAVVRTVLPNEWNSAVADCLADQGFIVKVTPDGGVESGEIKPSQQEPYAVAFYTCQASYPLDPIYLVPLNDEQLAFLYAYDRDTLAKCLENEGYQVPARPSEQEFVQNYEQTGGWAIYSMVTPGSADDWYAINKKCPQFPEGLYG